MTPAQASQTVRRYVQRRAWVGALGWGLLFVVGGSFGVAAIAWVLS